MALVSIFIVLVAISFFYRLSRRTNTPPGPHGYPLIGAALSMPSQREWITYEKWKRLYGRIVHVNVFGQAIAFLNDSDLAIDLLNRRSSSSAERPKFPMLELMGFLDWNLGIISRGPILNHGRKMMLQSFNPSTMPNYESMQTREVASLLIRLQDSPKDFESHLRRLNVAQIMNVFFGVELDEDDTHGFVRLNLDIMDVASPPGSMGAFLLNVFPDILHKPLSHWPTWLPGGSFMQVANKGYELCGKFLSFVDASGSAGAESFMHKYLSEATSETEKLAARAAAATSFSAGAETSTAVLLSTFLAMVLFPDVQKRAHEELDRVLQYGRLPTLEDRALNRLPYITAIYLECLRWAPPGSFGLPHLLTSNEIADGYTLPSGTIVMSNVWSILHDENIYASPMVFNPDRFIGENAQNDPRVHSFGYGKRSCPGRHLAESLLWLCIANILTVFDISPETDETGKPCFPVVDFTSGVMSRPLPFQCRILSRSQAYTDLIQRN